MGDRLGTSGAAGIGADMGAAYGPVDIVELPPWGASTGGGCVVLVLCQSLPAYLS